MKISQEEVLKWQLIWNRLCNMAYYRTDIANEVVTGRAEHGDIFDYQYEASNFQEITLDHTWKKFSSLKDENGNFLEALVVPEVQEIYVPRILFEGPGVYTWFLHSFPNCLILFWEDMA
jgi:hypothetical protein